MSRVQLAINVGSTYRVVVYWEQDQRIPTENHIEALAETLAVSADYLAQLRDASLPVTEPMEGGKNELLCERIKRLRLTRKLSQKQLAERLGCSHYLTVGQWENGRSVPSSSLLGALAREFGVSIDYLLYGRDAALLAALKAQIRQRAPYERLLAMVSAHD